MKLKSLLSGTAISALSVAPALAADMVMKAPPQPAFSWTGFYLGANLGGVRTQNSMTETDPFFLYGPAGTNFGLSGSSVIGGVQAGYNWQVSTVVVGLEADLDFASADQTTSLSPLGGLGVDTYRTRLSTLGTVRGRLGWAFDRVLLYSTGGVAFANLKNEVVDTIFPFTANGDTTATGWTIGGGAEYALTDRWTTKLEYLYAHFPDQTVTVVPFVPASYTFAFKDSASVVRAGINYKF